MYMCHIFLSNQLVHNFPYFSQQWLLDKQDLIRERQYDLSILTEEEYQKIFIFFASGKQLYF